jgi:hypothetical protein
MSEMKVTSTQLIHQANQAVDADLAKVLPYLRAMDDGAAVRALRELYDIAFNAAFKTSDGVIKDMGGHLSKIIAARLSGNTEALTAAVDEFMAARCIVKGGPAPTPSH